MTNKLLVVVAWVAGLLILALGCWVLGVFLSWQLWQSVALFIGIIVAGFVLAWLRRRWLAWRLRRRLARPTAAVVENTSQLDADWRAGLAALRQSRLSRFGSPLYVLPWFLAMGPDETTRSAMLRRVAARDAVTAGGDEQPVLQWWMLPGMVLLDPAPVAGAEGVAPAESGWKRMLHWMMHTRRREPLNGLVLAFSASWLSESGDAELAEAGQRLRGRLDELVRVYNARIPVYIVVTQCETLRGFADWAGSLGSLAENQAMGYLHKGALQGVGEFIDDAFGHIVARMGELRILQGRHEQPAPEAFGLPERMQTLAGRLDKVLRPAFQATPYAETPLLRGLFLTGSQGSAAAHQPDWFSTGLLNEVLPAQRDAWQPLERMRHWRRLARHALVTAWLLLCVAAGAFLFYASNTAHERLHMALRDAGKSVVDFSGNLSSDLHALQGVRHAVHTLDRRSTWERTWLPFQHHVNRAQARLQTVYADYFFEEVLRANLNPMLVKVLGRPQTGPADALTVALAQNLVRRINMLEARLAGSDLERLPLPGTELGALMPAIQDGVITAMDALLMGDMYRDYLNWQRNADILIDEQRALQKALSTMGLASRPIQWVHIWTDLQPQLQPLRISDFWEIDRTDGLPEVPAAMTLEGKKALTAFLKELAWASGHAGAWSERRAQYEQLFLDDGLQHWYAFSDAFVHAPQLMPDATARRTVLSSLFTPTDPYRRYLATLAELGASISPQLRPKWLDQAVRLNKLVGLVQLSDSDLSKASAVAAPLTTLQNLQVVQSFGGEVLKALPEGNVIKEGFASLSADQQALVHLQNYQQAVRSTTLTLQQGDGAALNAAVQIWSFGEDPQVKDVPLVDAYNAWTSLKDAYGASTDPRESVVWAVAGGAMNFALDYAARSAACMMQSRWEADVLGAVKGLTDRQLADSLLFGPDGQVNAFLDGDVKHFVRRNGTRYVAREALGATVPFSGQFYGFANQAQLRRAAVAGQMLAEQRRKEAEAALKDQIRQLDEKIAKLEDVKGNVTLRTDPPLTNDGALLRPESITLSLQCASGPIVLQNMNFTNSQVFPWSISTCADTELVIRYPGFELRQQWSGATGFIDFLHEFASGQRRYTPHDFPAFSQLMIQAGIEWLDISYRQQGQETVLKAFAEADKLHAQAQEIQDKLDAIHEEAVAAPQAQAEAGPTALPEQIVTMCMGPSSTVNRIVAAGPQPETGAVEQPAQAAQPAAAKPMKPASPPRPGGYAVQVGIFAHPERVRSTLQEAGYTIDDQAITLRGKEYRNIRATGYATREEAAAAAEKIGDLLNLEPVVVGAR